MKDFILEEKLAGLRNKWREAFKKGDTIACGVIERMAKADKRAAGIKDELEEIVEKAKEIIGIKKNEKQ